MHGLLNRGYSPRSRGWIYWALEGNPYFQMDYSYIIEVGGKIAGTYLSLIIDIKLGPRLIVPGITSLIVIDPDHRRKGLGTMLVDWARKKREADPRQISLIRIAPSSEETKRKFWSKLSNSPIARERAVTYTMLVDREPLKIASEKASREYRGGKQGTPLAVQFEISGLPRFCLLLGNGIIEVSEEIDAEVSIRGEFNESLSYLSIVKSIITGRLRINGLRHVLNLLRYRKAMRSFLVALQNEMSSVKRED